MQPSLAVLITGEVRTNQFLLQERRGFGAPDAQIFFSVWEKIGIKLEGWLGPWQILRVLGEPIGDSLPLPLIGNDQLHRFLPTFFERLRSDVGRKRVSRSSLKAITPFVDVEDQRFYVETLPPSARRSTARYIHYKFARAVAMMQIAEVEQGMRFKNAARMRPDLAAQPPWDLDFEDQEIFIDWFAFDESRNCLLAGDNVILARRNVIVELCEHMRRHIYELDEYDVHEIIGRFIQLNGLTPRQLHTPIGDDPWPMDLFLECLNEKASAAPNEKITQEFLACIDANTRLKDADLQGAAEVLQSLNGSKSPPILFCRGRLALAKGSMVEADEMISALQDQEESANLDFSYHRDRLMQLRAVKECAATEPDAAGCHSKDLQREAK